MLNRFATLAAVCMLAPVAVAPLASADPPPPPDPAAPAVDAGPPPDNGLVASAEPGIVTTPDGWKLTVAGSNESQLPVAPLTTAASSREYLVAGTFTGTATGGGSTSLSGGTLDTGYQIGCGIELGQVRLIGSIGLSTSGSTLAGLIPTGVSMPMSGTLEIHPKPGTVTTVSVNKKSFKAAPVRVTLKDVHIKIDGCVGQSFLRSYATLTSSTTDTDDVVAYYGVTKSV
ncbi:MspA family porin [Mycolicibacterium frederiksbergense]|nr:MspA family porin [Mycolicibacterium frederiksbergense]